MIPRAASLSRVCLECRRGIAQRRPACTAAGYFLAVDPVARRYASSRHPGIQTKERIEALISGKGKSQSEKKKKPSRQPVIQTKDRVEALISGRGELESEKKKRPSRRPVIQTKDRVGALISGKRDFERKKNEISRRKTKTAKLSSKGDRMRDIEFKSPQSPQQEAEIPFDRDLHLSQAEEDIPEEPRETAELPDLEAVETSQDAISWREFRDNLVNQEHLGVGALGRPADALIIKNPNKMWAPKKPLPILEEEEALPEAGLDWRDLVPKPNDTPSDVFEEVRQNIDELRPKDTSVLGEWAFNNLLNNLVEGFTRQQLGDYYRHATDDSLKRAEDIAVYPWIEEETPWNTSHPFDTRGLKPKQMLALMIMQTKWSLEPREQAEAVGQKQVKLKANTFRPVFADTDVYLDNIKADLLDESMGENIKLLFAEQTLIITARRLLIPAIFDRIDAVMQTRVSRDVAVGHINADCLHRSVLRVLGRITDTVLEMANKDTQPVLKVRWFGHKELPRLPADGSDIAPGQRVEDTADVVLRLLDSRTRSVPCRELQIQPSTKGSDAVGTFIEHAQAKRGMSWRDKLRAWYRYVDRQPAKKKQQNRPRNMAARLKLPSDHALAPGDERDNRLSATFGQVLHIENARKTQKNVQVRRVMCPVAPHPAALGAIANTEQTASRSASIILNFSPTSFDRSIYAAEPPDVRLTLPVDPNANLSSFESPNKPILHCVVPWYESDLLYPGGPVDVRFTQDRWLQLDTTDIATQQKHFKDFLDVSEFNLLQGRLKTPPSTSFNIPRKWLFLSKGQGGGADLVELPYRFVGLEIRQTVDTELEGHTLRYSSIEAGQQGGQRQELSLYIGPPDQQAQQGLAWTDVQKQDFQRLVGEVALGKHFWWDKGHEAMSAPSLSAKRAEQEDGSVDSEKLHETDEKDSLEASTDDTQKDKAAVSTDEEQEAPFTEPSSDEPSADDRAHLDKDSAEASTTTESISSDDPLGAADDQAHIDETPADTKTTTETSAPGETDNQAAEEASEASQDQPATSTSDNSERQSHLPGETKDASSERNI